MEAGIGSDASVARRPLASSRCIPHSSAKHAFFTPGPLCHIRGFRPGLQRSRRVGPGPGDQRPAVDPSALPGADFSAPAQGKTRKWQAGPGRRVSAQPRPGRDHPTRDHRSRGRAHRRPLRLRPGRCRGGGAPKPGRPEFVWTMLAEKMGEALDSFSVAELCRLAAMLGVPRADGAAQDYQI